MNYDKKQLLGMLASQLERKSSGIARAANNARQDAINAEGRMQTRYGSEKEESGYLADGLNLRRNEVEQGLSTLLALQLPENPSKVMSGSLVSIRDGSEVEYYFILPYGGGESIETDQGEVTVINPTAPIAKLMLNKKVGEQFPFRRGAFEDKYTILD